MAQKLSPRLINLKKIKKIDCRRNEENRRHNKRYRTILKNTVKEFKALVTQEIAGDAKQAAFSKLDKTIKQVCHKGVIHRNKRDRLLSRLYKYGFGK